MLLACPSAISKSGRRQREPCKLQYDLLFVSPNSLLTGKLAARPTMSPIGSTTIPSPLLRTCQMQRRVVIAVAILLCAAALRAADGPTRLPTIPDVGEPFDVKSFISVPFSYRNNAFTSYRHASRSYVAPQNAVKTTHQPGVPIDWASFSKSRDETLEEGWAHANADVRRWLEANEFALEIWHRGTECADAMDIPPADIHLGTTSHTEIRDFARLAWLKAARVTAQGKPADAWIWHRAALRSSAHVAMHAPLIGPLIGFAIYIGTADFVRRWSARPDLSASDLRQALADAIAVNEMTPPPSDAFKSDYLAWRTKGDRLAAIDAAVPNFAPLLSQLGYNERAARILNLVYANLLSQADRPPFRRTAVRGTLGLFGRGSFAPVNAKVYSDEEIEGKIPHLSARLEDLPNLPAAEKRIRPLRPRACPASRTGARPGPAASLPRARPISRHADRAGEERVREVNSTGPIRQGRAVPLPPRKRSSPRSRAVECLAGRLVESPRGQRRSHFQDRRAAMRRGKRAAGRGKREVERARGDVTPPDGIGGLSRGASC